MTVPDFQTIALPLLLLGEDGREVRLGDAIQSLASDFQLSAEERAELLPSGKQTRFANRVGWARTYLSKAGLLESSGRGVFRITERGRGVLAEKPAKITVAYLERFPELVAFKNATKSAQLEPVGTTELTPEEVMASGYDEFRRSLAVELLQQVKQRSPHFFENLVVDLLVRMGYGGSLVEAGRSVGRTRDGGIDGIIKEDKLGLDVVYVQAKRWEGAVGRPIVQAFAGSLEGHRARKGVLITTSHFSDDAKQYVTMIEKKIVLIDGAQLVGYMIEHGVGVAEIANYSLKRVALEDLDYFDDGAVVMSTPTGESMSEPST